MYNAKWFEDNMTEFIEKEGYKVINFIKVKGIESRLLIWCGNPNHKPYEVTFSKFRSGRRCNQCNIDKRSKWTKEKIIDYVEKNNYTFIRFENFNYNKSLMWIKCKEGHDEFKVTFNSFEQGSRCRRCVNDKKLKWTKEKIINFVEDNDYNFIKFIKYKGYLSRLLVSCKNNHNPYEVDFGNFRNGFRCPFCTQSRGEEKINKVLLKYNKIFKRQFTFEDLIGKVKPLPFDFLVYKSDNQHEDILIEFDGMQHYKPVEYFGGYDHFIITKHNDGLKNEYCYFNHIKLIRIPYWDYNNIEEILIKELNLK